MAAVQPVLAQDDTQARALPAPTTVGNASFISGGIGIDESEAMKAAAAKYSLELVFSARSDRNAPGASAGASAAYTADVKVRITDRSGKTVIDTVSQGPYLLANLPDGAYQVEASADGAPAKTQKTTIKKGTHQRLVFSWAD
ncbi:carboxypeptidase regulatory-like domain-containing protein [Oxalobacteraceae bacterium CAVE-383]|nr:carboxypeptidase regulatory-like domain-containing protein [Oxalobacteraceae bacterium CAVE-383]